MRFPFLIAAALLAPAMQAQAQVPPTQPTAASARPMRTPEQKAQRRAARQAKEAAMTPDQRQAFEQKRAARRAARQQMPGRP